MTPDDVMRLRNLLATSTPGPWTAWRDGSIESPSGWVAPAELDFNDAAFCVAAHESMQALLDALDAAWAKVNREQR